MDTILTDLCFTYESMNGTIEIWGRPGFAYYEYRLLREGKEVSRSDSQCGSVDAALLLALHFVLDN